MYRIRAPSAIAICVAAAVALTTYIRAGMLHRDTAAEQTSRELQIVADIAEGQREFRRLRVIPLDTLTRDELRAHLESIAGGAPSFEIDPASRRLLLDAASDLLFHRYMQRSPEVYRQWRVAGGFRFKSMQALNAAGVPFHYKFFFGEPFPGESRLAESFDRMWSSSLAADRDRPSAVAAESGGIAVAFSEADQTQNSAPPVLAGQFPPEIWHGSRQVGHRFWWDDPNGGVKGELAERTRVRTAILAVVLEFGEGDRYPLALSFYQDSVGNWWLWRVNVLNVASDRFRIVEF